MDFNYVERLYFIASRKATSAESTKKVVKRINRAAAKSEKPESAVSGDKIVKKPGKNLDLKEAWEMAKRGEKLDLDDLR